jgi:hypothetical protein
MDYAITLRGVSRNRATRNSHTMRLTIDIPDPQQAVSQACPVPLAIKGVTWKESCLGKQAKETGVYVIHAPDPIPTSRPLSHRLRPSILAPPRPWAPLLLFRADSRQLQHPSFAPFNLHKARVRRASGFLLTAFSNARPNLQFRSTLLTKGAPPKKH